MYTNLRLSKYFIPKNINVVNFHHNLGKIGDRDIVGYGINGSPCYSDNFVYPMPAIRWKENTTEVMRLRKMELGDWKKISLDDKKSLYRASFRQTYAEFEAGGGCWKQCISGVFISVTLALWYYIWLYKTVYEIPDTFSPEKQKAQVIRMILLMVNPITGISSKFDYDNWKWKDNKNSYFKRSWDK